MSPREQNALVGLLAGALVLTGPARTRPLAGFLYGLFLSRAQGSSRQRLERTVADIFDQRKSLTVRVEALSGRVEDLERRGVFARQPRQEP